MRDYVYYNAKKRVTMVARPTGHGVDVGVAVCSEKDKFDYEIGKIVAAERANQKPHFTLPVMDKEKLYAVLPNLVDAGKELVMIR